MTTELMILKIGVACFTLLSLILIWIFYACRRLKVKICIHKNSGVYKFFFFFFSTSTLRGKWETNYVNAQVFLNRYFSLNRCGKSVSTNML